MIGDTKSDFCYLLNILFRRYKYLHQELPNDRNKKRKFHKKEKEQHKTQDTAVEENWRCIIKFTDIKISEIATEKKKNIEKLSPLLNREDK